MLCFSELPCAVRPIGGDSPHAKKHLDLDRTHSSKENKKFNVYKLHAGINTFSKK